MPKLPPPPPQRYARPPSGGSPQKTEPCSVAGLVLGVAGLVPLQLTGFIGACLFGPASLALGVVGLIRIRQSPSTLKGMPVAIVAVIVGAVHVGFLVWASLHLAGLA